MWISNHLSSLHQSPSLTTDSLLYSYTCISPYPSVSTMSLVLISSPVIPLCQNLSPKSSPVPTLPLVSACTYLLMNSPLSPQHPHTAIASVQYFITRQVFTPFYTITPHKPLPVSYTSPMFPLNSTYSNHSIVFTHWPPLSPCLGFILSHHIHSISELLILKTFTSHWLCLFKSTQYSSPLKLH